jgi:pseudaminic acid synthase
VTAKAISIGGRLVGPGQRTFIIAELSANHGQDLEKAIRTIEAAAEAGADAIKIQTYTPDTMTLRSNAPHFVVRTKNVWAGRTLYDLYAEAMTPWEWHARLQVVAKRCGLIFFSTPFDPTAVEYLEDLSVPCHKIASFELTDLPLVEHVAARGRPMILSTGMASLGEIEAAVEVCRSVGNDRLALLRCVSAYPADAAAMNLSSLTTLASFGTVIGLSDHTRDATAAIAAVALGATIVEKHFILQRSDGGPDAFFSIEPQEFRAMVSAIRDVERAVGTPRFGAAEEERPSTVFRRSLIVARPVAAGQVLTCDDVRSIRPSVGLAPRHLPEVLGRTAARALAHGEPLTWDAVAGLPRRPAVRLRPATEADAELLLAWRNDARAVENSGTGKEVPPEEHRKWLSERIGASPGMLLVAHDEYEEAVGSLRLDPMSVPATSSVSIILAPTARGRRLASAILGAVEEPARAQGHNRLVARIQASNEPALRTFKAAGYYQFIRRQEAAGDKLWCERRLRSFA